MPKNPMNDDDYTGNDEQISDLKTLVDDTREESQRWLAESDRLECEKTVLAADCDRLKDTTAELVVVIHLLLAEIDDEIEQRQTDGNDEAWGELKSLADQAHAIIHKATI